LAGHLPRPGEPELVQKRAQKLDPLRQRYAGEAAWTTAVEDGSHDLLEDLRILNLGTQQTAITWLMAAQAAKAARDEQLLVIATGCHSETEIQAKWFTTRIKTGAPRALVVG
jgi:hypothetical protein